MLVINSNIGVFSFKKMDVKLGVVQFTTFFRYLKKTSHLNDENVAMDQKPATIIGVLKSIIGLLLIG